LAFREFFASVNKTRQELSEENSKKISENKQRLEEERVSHQEHIEKLKYGA
jgi:hypothetical protein